MGWLKIETHTAEKPEMLRLGGILKVSRAEAFFMCFKFWCWADSQTADGNVLGVTGVTVDELIGCDGFSDAMVVVGWLVITESGISIPRFSNHMAQSAKTRAVTANRVAKHRASCNGERNVATVTEALPEKIREDEIREDESVLPINGILKGGAGGKLCEGDALGQFNGYQQAFLMAWGVYPERKRTNKASASIAWSNAATALSQRFDGSLSKAEDWLFQRIKQFSKTALAGSKFCPGIESFLAKGRYDDPDKAWESDEDRPKKSKRAYQQATPPKPLEDETDGSTNHVAGNGHARAAVVAGR